MRRCTAQWINPAFWILSVAALQACAPLTDGLNNNTSSSCYPSVLQNNGPIGVGQTNVAAPSGTFIGLSTNYLAQSFEAATTTTISAVSLNLDAVVPTGTTTAAVSITVYIEPDLTGTTTGTPTPTSPAGVTSTGVISSLGSATTTTAIPISVNGSATAQFITFPVSAPLTQGQIYWIVAVPNYSPNAITYVEWRYGTTALLNQLADYFSPSNTWVTVSTSINYDFKVGC
jgi:hypothetical protein